MPDLKTALTSAIKQWDDEGAGAAKPATIKPAAPAAPAPAPQGVGQAEQIFMCVLANNKVLKRVDVQRTMVLRGMSSASASSVLAQLIRHGFVRENDEHKLYTTRTKWDAEAWRAANRNAYVKKPKAAPKAAPQPVVPAAPAAGVTLLTAEYVAANISLAEAAKLLRILKEMF